MNASQNLPKARQFLADTHEVVNVSRELGDYNWLTIAIADITMVVAPFSFAQSEQQKLVDAANAPLSNFVRDPEMTWLQQNRPRVLRLYNCQHWLPGRHFGIGVDYAGDDR
jgi:hypothetical protein